MTPQMRQLIPFFPEVVPSAYSRYKEIGVRPQTLFDTLRRYHAAESGLCALDSATIRIPCRRRDLHLNLSNASESGAQRLKSHWSMDRLVYTEGSGPKP
jgi:hypothetical protein